ncbi:hydroxyacid dehydrogenase [Brevibacillus marinus]|uniref:hydroxyacid dehydrogenase n=1 Tax=Brevibacillus marinus TaxID=2496837 RepID=UPI000F841721|nr:hydroxyacid dehydrogenase [Brevibacillus marinus]
MHKVMQILSMYHPAGEKWLAEHADVVRVDDHQPEAILSALGKHPDVEGIILRAPARITRSILDAAPSVRVISGAGVGVDNIDVAYATEKGIAVLHAPKVNAESTAEHAVALLFALSKQIVLFDQEMRKMNFAIRNQVFPHELKGKVLGLVGWGEIARHVARICGLGLGMQVVAYVRSLSEEKTAAAAKLGVTLTTDLAEVFRVADAVSVHIPLTENTRGLIDRKLLRLLKPNAYFINTARGAVVNEQDLYQVLQEKRIAGAALDVFSQEPPTPDIPFHKLDNVVLTPHVGGITEEASRISSALVARNVLDYLDGKTPKYIVNPQVLPQADQGEK